MNKKLLLIIIMTILSIFTVSATDYYQEYRFSYDSAIPTDVYVVGGECNTNSCSSINFNDGKVEYYTLGAKACFADLTLAQMNTCVAPYRIAGNVVPNNGVIIKFVHDVTENPTLINQFSAAGDTYLVKYWMQYNFPKVYSDYDYSVTPITPVFNKQANAIAEIQELNIKNIDNPLKPIQIEIPVSIDNTVCSAFMRGNPELEVFNFPLGYSDFQANTKINLLINQVDTGVLIRNETITIPILADTCAGLSAFSWTPDSSYLNKRTKFTVTTDVIDNQVSSSIQDVASVIERVYPGDLSNSCWARSYDFKLSNLPQDLLNTSLAQTVVGESLYAVSKNAAFRTNAITPMNYEVVLLFDGVQKYNQVFSTPPAATEDDFALNIVNLSPTLAVLPAGIYNVTLITRPIGAGCTVIDEVKQYQKLIVEDFSTNVVTFTIIDEDSNVLSGATVNLNLLKTRDYFIIPPVYSSTLVTNPSGQAIFGDAYAGLHKYTASYPGLFPTTRNLYVGSDMGVTVKLYATNQLPFIDLPAELITYYLDPVSVNLRDYADDYNDDFDSLIFTTTLVSGIGNAAWNPVDDTLTFTSTVINDAVFRVTVTDPHGASASDLITVKFTNNHPPVINTFKALPNNGQAPFNTIFDISVSDLDAGDILTCTLEYGDGSSSSGLCSALDEINHIYTNVGTYVAKLTAFDGTVSVIATENIFVFNRTTSSPLINSFTLASSNGNFVPTDLTLNWNVTHSGGLATSCYLRVNGVQNNVPCLGSNFINDFNITGISRFHIIAIDSTGLQVIRSIERTFYDNSSMLTPTNTQLVVSSVIEPGEFPFAIATLNESLAKRTIEVKPIIDCGFENTIPVNNGFLNTKAVSKKSGNINVFEFKTNTQDFAGKVPTDIGCTFKVLVRDDIGSSFMLSKDVMFQYATETLKYKSIRGRGTDIVNYMSSTLMSGMIKRGYNIVSFTVTNNEAIEKKLSITMMSQSLNIESQESISLAPGQSREIQIPLYIDKDIAPGMYPVRYAVRDNEDKQVKYSYILVE